MLTFQTQPSTAYLLIAFSNCFCLPLFFRPSFSSFTYPPSLSSLFVYFFPHPCIHLFSLYLLSFVRTLPRLIHAFIDIFLSFLPSLSIFYSFFVDTFYSQLFNLKKRFYCSGILDSTNTTTHRPSGGLTHSSVIGWELATTGTTQSKSLMAGDWT